jgi:hypothetical protein
MTVESAFDVSAARPKLSSRLTEPDRSGCFSLVSGTRIDAIVGFGTAIGAPAVSLCVTVQVGGMSEGRTDSAGCGATGCNTSSGGPLFNLDVANPGQSFSSTVKYLLIQPNPGST